ncbi:MAG: O-antigen ligase family protein [bacterium]
MQFNTLVRISGINKVLIYLPSFFYFVGFYALLILFINIGFYENTENITMLIRFLASLFAILFIIINRKIYLKITTYLIIFLVFSIFYLFRISNYLYFSDPNVITSIPKAHYFLYYVSYALIPFIFFAFIKTEKHLHLIYKSLIHSFFIFLLVSLYFYIDLLFLDVSRINIGRYLGYKTISPLIISYCSAFIMGISLYSILNFKTNRKFYLILIIISFIPFLLGSSRGSMVSLVFAALFYLLAKKGIKSKIYLFIIFIGVISVLYYLSIQFDVSLFNRLYNTNFSENIRINTWKQSLVQFSSQPLIGEFVEAREYGGYPHNIVLEALISTGIIGGLFLVTLIGLGLNYAMKIIGQYPSHGWVSILFIQTLTYNMFSGALYMGGWFWGSLSLVFATYTINKKTKRNENFS